MNSVLRRRLFKTLHSNHSSPFSTSVSGLISSRLRENPQKDAIRFENQNKTWTYKELEQHSNAFAYGLLELGYKRGDRVVLWVDRANTSEITVAQIGMAKAGVSFVPLTSSSAQDLQKTLKDSEAKGLIFSGNTKEGGKRRGDLLYEIFPELETAHAGAPLNLSNYPKLKNLVNTGFHSLPGTIKYRQLLVYGSPKFQTNKLSDDLDGSVPLIYAQKDGRYKDYKLSDIHDFAQKFRSDNKVEAGDSIVVSGCPYCPGTFASGAYQSLAFGNYVILSGNEDFKTLVSKLHSQQPNYIVINQSGNEQLNETPAEGSLDRLKGVLVSGKDTNQYKNVFGGKSVSSFNTYW